MIGDGFQLSGCMLVHLLGQRHKLDLFDFSSYLVSVASFGEKASERAAGVDLNRFIAAAQFFRSLNDAFFQMLQAALPAPSSGGGVGTFMPPTADGPEGEATYVPYEGEHGTAQPVVSEGKMVVRAEEDD